MRIQNGIFINLIFILFNFNTLFGQGIKYEAEAGILTGALSIQSSQQGFSGTGYVGRFENDGDKVAFSINISEAGSYKIYIGFAAPYGDKINNVVINGNTIEVAFPNSSTFREVLAGKISLGSGSNSLSVNKSWGWFLLDYIRIEPNTDPVVVVKIPYQLVTASSMVETRRLFNYLMDNFGKNIHSGTMSLNGIEEAEWLYSRTGKYPALIGLDFMNHTRNWSWYDKTILVNEARKWYKRNGLVAVCWHWRDPLRITDEFYTDKTSFDVSKISDPTSAEYNAMVSDIDIVSDYIKQLQDSAIPFIFRPLHEASGKWFWWGAKGPEPCKALWRFMYNRMVNYHGLKNMIWVWTTDAKADNMSWYPGDEYVDILGVDIYAANGDFGSQVLTYNKIKDDFKGNKLITLSENGPVPDPDLLVADKSQWSWFMTWYGTFVRDPAINPLSQWQKVMNHKYVITLDEMPDLKNYPLTMTTNPEEQGPQGFFLNNWQPKVITNPEFIDIKQTSDPVTVSVKIDFNDTISKISRYLFGDNANLWTGCMSDNNGLMKYIANRNIGVLRGPGGSISDVFFWNRNVNQRPADVPLSLAGQTDQNWLWYGNRPYSWETWTMAVDSFYSVLGQVKATGMITINYGYARYGTGSDPVAKAAHMAADWVRYDKGRTKFWEIGNEVSGSWEAGYRIDLSQNKDGQPEYINGTLYGKHALVFIDSMKAAANETGVDIKIGLVMCEAYSSSTSTWNMDVAAQAGNKADFYIVHSYFTPYNENSSVETILNSYTKTGSYKTYVWSELDKAGKPHLPVALTEYNIFAIGSNQPVSHVNGIHAVLVTGEAMKTGYGAALRWDLANGWSNGNDHGMFSYGSEPGVSTYAPRPAFYHLYYLQKYTGDVLLNSTMTGASGVVIIPTAFQSGKVGAAIINTAKIQKVVRLNIKNFKFGDRYYTYTLTGGSNIDFSRKVFINDIGNSLEAGGPDNYASIKANSSLITDEIRIKIPPLSVTFVLIEPGNKELIINEEIVGVSNISSIDNTRILPNPSKGQFSIIDMPEGIDKIEILNISGLIIYTEAISGKTCYENITRTNLIPGIYFVNLTGKGRKLVKKLVVN
jgi:hypothetical protein